MKKKILITGAAGFIGYHLVKELAKNIKNEITIIDNLYRGKIDKNLKKLARSKKIKFIKKDLSENFNFKNNYDYIFHLAAIVGVSNVKKQPIKTFKTNLISTIKLIDAFNVKKKKPVFILFSTSEVYQPLIDKKKLNFPTTENQDFMYPRKFNPRQSYYLSKFFSEIILKLSGLKYIIYRPHNIYGPRMGYSHVIPELFLKFKSNKKKIGVFSPNHKRAFCYVDDAINLILNTCFNKKALNNVFNIGNMSQETKIIDLAKKIKKILNSNKGIILKENTQGSPSRRLPNISKIQKISKFKNFTKLQDGLKRTLKWYEENY